MSREYDLYLQDHRDSVKKAFEFIRDKIPSLVPVDQELRLTQQICFDHDRSKNTEDEYEPYDEYFYGKNRIDHIRLFRIMNTLGCFIFIVTLITGSIGF